MGGFRFLRSFLVFFVHGLGFLVVFLFLEDDNDDRLEYNTLFAKIRRTESGVNIGLVIFFCCITYSVSFSLFLRMTKNCIEKTPSGSKKYFQGRKCLRKKVLRFLWFWLKSQKFIPAKYCNMSEPQ